jgi:hypothetical protein
MMFKKNPNMYFYRHNEPGVVIQKTGNQGTIEDLMGCCSALVLGTMDRRLDGRRKGPVYEGNTKHIVATY